MKPIAKSILIPFLLGLLLFLLILGQNIGGRYGSYALFSWLWLLTVLLPLGIKTISKNVGILDFRFFILAYSLAILFVLIQPMMSQHPIYTLGIYLLFYVPMLLYWVFKSKNQQIPFSIAAKTLEGMNWVEKCRYYISTDSLDKVFELLRDNLETNIEHYPTYILLSSRWHRMNKDREKSTITENEASTENAKITQALISLLDEI